MGPIYISSLAFKDFSVDAISQVALENGFSIEFTSNIPHSEDLLKDFLRAPIKKMVHNYFPTPKSPFVLNLASADSSIRDRSIQHCLKGLEYCKDSMAPFFAAHAGFCIDPRPEDLGGNFKKTSMLDREAHLDLFVQSLKKISPVAERMRIPFFFENNVLIKSNFSDGINPLLCCESGEIKSVLDASNSPFIGFLLDTAHLKVSCRTLGIERDNEVLALEPIVGALHHSDNDSTVDNNKPLTSNYWFLKWLPKFKECVHVVEVGDLTVDAIRIQISLLTEYGNR